MAGPDMRHQKLIVCAVLTVCFAAIAAVRLHTFNEPLERDLAGYMVIGNELLHGKRLYSEIWDQKPPAIHYAYASAIAAVGYGPQAVYLLGLLTSGITLVGVYVVGREIGGDRLSGILAAVIFSVVCSDLGLEANQPNVEVFMNACTIWFLALLFIGRRIGARWRWGLILGVVAAAGTLFKQVTAPLFFLMGFGFFLLPAPSDDEGPRRQWGQALSAALVVTGAWLAVCFWYWAQGDWQQFYGAVVLYNRFYAGNLVASLFNGLRFDHLFPAALRFCWPLVATGMFWLATAMLDRRSREALVMAGAGLGTWLAVSLPAHYFPHYYQLWLPLLAVVAALGLARMWTLANGLRGSRRTVLRIAAVASGIAVFGLVAEHQLPGLRTPAGFWPLAKYKVEGRLFCEIPSDAKWIDTFLGSQETFFEWGLDPGLYYYSRRRPMATLAYCHPLLSGPLVNVLEEVTLKQLQAGEPRLIVISKPLLGLGLRSPSLAWIRANYQVVESAPESDYFGFFGRR
jgi:4-amino-4-deoxy-L-arabinose transferase-like glycosyltransferase